MNIEKIQKLIKLLSSSSDGEVLAAARALLRTLHAEGSDIHALAERVEGRKLSQAERQRIYDKAFADGKKSVAATAAFSDTEPTFYDMACAVKEKADGRLGSKEQGFVDDMIISGALGEPPQRNRRIGYATSTAGSDDADDRETAKTEITERRPGQPTAGAGPAVSAAALGALAVGVAAREVDKAAVHPGRN